MAQITGIVIGTKARVLVAALALSVASIGLSAGQAEARRYDNGVRCALERQDGYIDFYMPGYSFRVGNIKTTCNRYGERASVHVGPRGR